MLEVKNLKTEFFKGRRITVVSEVSFSINKGEVLGLVGESGCGKSVTSLSIMRLLKRTTGRVTLGEVYLDGIDLLKLTEREMCKVRGKDISMIFQDPMSSLNPTMSVGKQITESILLHTHIDKDSAKQHALELVESVGIPEAKNVLNYLPYQLSGGMSQRIMIAMAMACLPKLLIADEPTTALDVTIQAQVLELMRNIKNENQTSILLITHDLGVVAEMCDRVIVMYAGRIFEEAGTRDLFENPQHPYTRGLIKSIPVLGKRISRLNNIQGNVPDLANIPAGCVFHPRCDEAMEKCRTMEPSLDDFGNGRKCRCWLHSSRKGKKV